MRRLDRGDVALLVCGAAAALLYSNFLLDFTRTRYVGLYDIVSQLEAHGQPNAMFLRVTDVICVVLVACLLPWVRAALPRGAWREVVVWSTVVFGIGAATAAFVPEACGPDVTCVGGAVQNAIHDGSSIASDTALYVGVAAAWLATRRTGPLWFARAAWWIFWIGGVVTSLLFTYFQATDNPAWAVGVSQRVHIVCISVWIMCLAVFAVQGRRPRAESPTADAPTRLRVQPPSGG
ncbi:MAG TPA: hypothetical protein DEQ43_14995 [Nocardioides bacterium]|uniref:DUF998 domain-containing protein n=1 Tax=uncultured Nocardioides sp. TaxID=198441 RepID=UPI000EED0138|nr:DUF998 domain-containing protein [uncultured Nocardioides sp.]HCB05527.1 hypothetical protein [Nocardioides sp.]